MSLITIRNNETGEEIFSHSEECNTIAKTVMRAIELGISLSLADLSSADLRSADLSFADLSSANLSSTNLFGAALGFADLGQTKIIRMDCGGWSICIYKKVTKIGCETHANVEWLKWTPSDVAHMAEGAEAWWAERGERIKAAIRYAMS